MTDEKAKQIPLDERWRDDDVVSGITITRDGVEVSLSEVVKKGDREWQLTSK